MCQSLVINSISVLFCFKLVSQRRLIFEFNVHMNLFYFISDILQKILNTLKGSREPLLAKDVAQKSGIGRARSDVNRYLYFLKEQRLVIQEGNLWRVGMEHTGN